MSAEKRKQPAAVEREDAQDTVTTKRILLDCLSIMGITGLADESDARLVDVADYLRDRLRRSGAAAVNVADAPNVEGARSCPAPGWAALRWTAEYPRASGVWWWWNQDDRCAPEIVEVKQSVAMDYLEGGPSFQYIGLTRRRLVRKVGGLWAGPVEPPATRDEATPPNEKLTDRTVENQKP